MCVIADDSLVQVVDSSELMSLSVDVSSSSESNTTPLTRPADDGMLMVYPVVMSDMVVTMLW